MDSADGVCVDVTIATAAKNQVRPLTAATAAAAAAAAITSGAAKIGLWTRTSGSTPAST
jgi:hypothetical protein